MTPALVIGWITRSRFIHEHEMRDFGYGPRVVVAQGQLDPIGRTFAISESDIAGLAEARNGNKRTRGVADRKVDPRASSVEVDRLGLCAELAAGQLLGLAPDLSIYDGPDPGYDFQLAWGTLDVKATRHPHGMLLFNDVHAFRADAAMLVVVPDR